MKFLIFFVILNAIFFASSDEPEAMLDNGIEHAQKIPGSSIPVAPAVDQPTQSFTELGFRLLGIYSKIFSKYHRNHLNIFLSLSSSQSD